MSCCSAKKTATDVNNNTDTSAAATAKHYDGSGTNLPDCIKKLIVKFQKEDKQNPPRSIYSYNYNEKTVYYVPAICCDFFSDLYDGDCKLLGHPDGGFTGRGDGTVADFMKTKTNEKLIWKDQR